MKQRTEQQAHDLESFWSVLRDCDEGTPEFRRAVFQRFAARIGKSPAQLRAAAEWAYDATQRAFDNEV